VPCPLDTPSAGARYRLELTLIGLLALAAAACSGSVGPGRGGAQAAAIAPASVVRGPFQRELLLTGELEAVRSVNIKAPQTAIFQMRIQFMAEEGSVVSAGDPILDFDNSALAAQFQELETQILDAETQIIAKQSELASDLKDLEIEVAEKEYEYKKTKVDASIDPMVLSRKDFSERSLALEKATEELEETRERIELTRDRGKAEVDVLTIDRDKLRKNLLSVQNDLRFLAIKAPTDGLVVYEERPGTTLRFQEGDSCWPGQGVLHLPDLSEMQVAFTVNEVDAPLIAEGMDVRISLDAFPGRELMGEIRHVPSMAVKRSETSKIAIFKVIARLEETWVGEMKPGMSVLGRVVVESLEDAPLVARGAVRFDGTSYWLRAGASGEPDADPVEVHPESRNVSHYLLSEAEYARLGGSPHGDGPAPQAFAEGS